jgi:hypothetical protein
MNERLHDRVTHLMNSWLIVFIGIPHRHSITRWRESWTFWVNATASKFATSERAVWYLISRIGFTIHRICFKIDLNSGIAPTSAPI